ncbi:SAM-dependent methyltransferase [Rhizorhabdus dicambivorans]|uniref:Class I SAM-dependent methyltransferase n=1 Tax=Rhizorhabdus dicambivorans TaxID=1850238 RepID=A0A2A4G0R8_9SPHN|nr:cyclopropane-fatty-acyl-phospholipid synthase family protein [Rhizorhabdus dicambivorans]ATE65051.1 class I SAM-dependent methyltransferase [Rhizorhabdus dicambivorans]PCE44325.1 class I SAM-dependent methyltransferase [Rhizorhabdus dicambivorans]
MNAQPPVRGQHLLRADRRFATGSSWLARLLSPGFQRLLDTIDKGLVEGAIQATLPDGSFRVLGNPDNGPVAICELRNWRPLVRLVTTGSVGWYRSWAEGEWTSPDPVPIFDLFMRNRHPLGELGRAQGPLRFFNLIWHAFRRNSRANARKNIAFHYDLGNDFYELWLDRTMSYSSALFQEPISRDEPLEAAQHRKITALLDRLDLKPGSTLLEIGCGWGGLAEVAASEYGADVTGITLSVEQKAFADERMERAGLADRARFEICDYRDVIGRYDAVASVEMVEAVGEEYWGAYMEAIARALKPGGRAALQYIEIDDAIFESYRTDADFIQTYIFPGGMLISESRFRAAAEKAGLRWEASSRKGFGLHYAETLRRWRERFDAAVEQGGLPRGFDEAFVKLWRFYLMYCEGGFAGGGIDVAQVTLVKA